MLKSAGFCLPARVHIHGFLTVRGAKMSKSSGTFVMAETYLKNLDPSYLRYYYASKLGPRTDDIDLNLDEFVAKVNSDLVGKVVNLASRTAKFAQRLGLSAEYPEDGGLFEHAAQQGRAIADAYETCDFNRAMRLIMELADRANVFCGIASTVDARQARRSSTRPAERMYDRPQPVSTVGRLPVTRPASLGAPVGRVAKRVSRILVPITTASNSHTSEQVSASNAAGGPQEGGSNDRRKQSSGSERHVHPTVRTAASHCRTNRWQSRSQSMILSKWICVWRAS